MLSVREACVLGAVQGATEFLPVSSSGHLAVVHHLLHPLPAAEMAAIDVALHVGTLAAVIAYFRRDLLAMLRACVRREPTWERWWVVLLAVGSVPAGVLGVAVHERIEASFGSLGMIGVCFMVTGMLLWLAQRAAAAAERGAAEMRVSDAVAVGLFQAAALFPGISRSGSTIAGGMLRRIDREVAAKFSFLLGIPAIAGAQLAEWHTLVSLQRSDAAALVAGTLVSGVTGLLAIGALMRLVRADRLHYFALYLWPLGAVVLGVGLARGW
jgi:undecaprenyl-diphosphatase